MTPTVVSCQPNVQAVFYTAEAINLLDEIFNSVRVRPAIVGIPSVWTKHFFKLFPWNAASMYRADDADELNR